MVGDGDDDDDGRRLRLPRVVQDCLTHLRTAEGLTTEGVFRLSPPFAVVRIAKDAYDRGQALQLATFQQDGLPASSSSPAPAASAHLAAALLKLYLSSLPVPLISMRDYHLIEKAPTPRALVGHIANPDADDDADDDDKDVVLYIRERLLPHWQSQRAGAAKVLLLASVLELMYEASLRSRTWACLL